MLSQLEACSAFKYVAVDTEGYAPNLLGISLSHPGLTSMYFPLGHKEDVNIDASLYSDLRDLLFSIPYRVFHHAAHDTVALDKQFATGTKMQELPFICTMIMGHMVDENVMSKGLDYMHKVHCGGEGKVKDPLMQSIIDTMGWEYVPYILMSDYATMDAQITMELFLALKKKYEEQFGPIWSL